MFALLLDRAKSALGHVVATQALRVAAAVPFALCLGYALAAIATYLTEHFGRAEAYGLMAAGTGAIGVAASLVLSLRDRNAQQPQDTAPANASLPDPGTATRANAGAAHGSPAQRPFTIWGVLRGAIDDWFRHRATRLGAALAYYSVFSLGPLLLIVTSVAGLLFGQDAVQGALTDQFRGLLGDTGSQAVEAMLKGAAVETSGYIAAMTGVALLIVAALGVVVQLKDALNTVWEAPEPQHTGIWGYLRTYLISLVGILGLGFLLAVSLVISTVLAAMSGWMGGGEALLWQVVNFLVPMAVLAVLFGALFRFFPDTEVEWRDVWPGAIVSSVLFSFGKLALSWYIGTQGLESTYGAAASVVVLLIWVYWSAQIVLFGAEVSHVYATRRQGTT